MNSKIRLIFATLKDDYQRIAKIN